MTDLTVGADVILDRDCSPQFVVPLRLRLIRVVSHDPYTGWCWLDGYELDMRGDAVRRRELYCLRAAIRAADPIPVARPRSRVPVAR